MKLIDLLKVVDPILDVHIWTQCDTEESGPSFSGSMLDIPWVFIDREIGYPEGQYEGELPIFIGVETNEYGVELPYMAINIIDK